MTDRPAPSSSGAGADIDADLAISVDGPQGRATAELTGSGRQLTLRTDHPEILLAAGRGAGAGLVDVLGAAGVRAELHGPRGRLATLDPDRTSSRVGRILGTGRHLRVDPRGWGALARASTHEARAALRRIDSVALFTAAAAAVAAAVAARLARGQRRREASGRRS